MSLRADAQQVLQICDAGAYPGPDGAPVRIAAPLAAAVAGTRLYRPDEVAALRVAEAWARDPGGGPVRVTVTDETSQVAAQRLAAQGATPAVLNFASARNPGGGFLRGAKAQEEDLCRCSGLFPCLLGQADYYAANRRERSLIYTDHLIWSPAVPFFATERGAWLPAPFLASVITSPAPNGLHLEREPADGPAFYAAFERRIGQVLAVAATHGHRRLVLGAWGCGAFANDAARVAPLFDRALRSDAFRHAFDEVVFAVYAPGRHVKNLVAFREVFG